MDKKSNITQEYVKNLKIFTPSFLCNFEDNIYDIIFSKISIKEDNNNNNGNNKVVLQIKNNNFIPIKDIPRKELEKIKELEQQGIENSLRMMKYHMNLSKLPNNLILKYEFKVGQLVKDFCFIEKFYLNNQLIEVRNIDLNVCSKDSTNAISFGIDIGKYKNKLKNNPNIKGDTFIFVEKKLVIHNKFWLYFSE